ncbi:MAG: Asp-tRNA(Asn)/Glu-tRNA(Gln) amidotransferase subunit GatC [Thermodesulfovibrionales bacterium]|nr:Asp-tRNA(Asn)/Glu-tRNA(Gln) amidotransferase subunit GatC [Thermodesulfovibrionales bacterium]
MIEKKQVEHIARLSRLVIPEEEKEMFCSQLSNVLKYMEKLNRLDTKGIEPTSHVIDLVNVMRGDAPSPSLPPSEALRNAPDRTEKFYRVPKIIE